MESRYFLLPESLLACHDPPAGMRDFPWLIHWDEFDAIHRTRRQAEFAADTLCRNHGMHVLRAA